MKAIVNVDANWGIGLSNELLFSLSADMKYFVKQTTGKVVVMGHSTLQSFKGGKPLPKRTNIILSRNKDLLVEGATVTHSLGALAQLLEQYPTDDIMVIGGQTIYEQLLDYCSTIYVTKVESGAKADSYFPNLDKRSNWVLANTSEAQEEQGVRFTFNEYHNLQVKSLKKEHCPNTVLVRDTLIGSGTPKICTSLVGEKSADIVKECQRAIIAGADIIEWRVDHFIDLQHLAKVASIIKELRTLLGNTPLLFTVRTSDEGGAVSLSDKEYSTIIASAVESGDIDMIDLQYSRGATILKEALVAAKKNNCATILSYHNFTNTPSQAEMMTLLKEMNAYDGDILKLAVYPQKPEDVITLLSITIEAASTFLCPIVTMSMSWLGSISRISGEFFGSSITFGAVGETSAPGQLEVQKLRGILQILEEPEQKGLI